METYVGGIRKRKNVEVEDAAWLWLTEMAPVAQQCCMFSLMNTS